jgi:c(7)-type cytochrome triheme protein
MRRLAALLLAAAACLAQAQERGRQVYEKSCALCHGAGIAGAPRVGAAADWSARLARGNAALYASALGGTPRGMPARGGNLALKDAEVRAAVDYMLSRLPRERAPVAKPAASGPAETKPVAAKAPEGALAVSLQPAPTPEDADVNAFNRLLRPAGKQNPPPAEDGIHDAAVDGTHALQAPRQAYAALPRANAGNRVDWVQALAQKRIAPRWDRVDASAAPVVMDMNIVREVKGSMPDVVYPHRQHTEWLDCSNCHPSIFVPQKGANQISMAAILLGQACGTCHGKVAFPVSECRLCHSKKKDLAAGAAPQAAGAAAK